MTKNFARFPALLLLTAVSVFAQAPKLESIGPFANSAASEALKKALEPKGSRVLLSDGNVLCEIWISSSVSTGKNEAQGAGYTWLAESTFVGVITFPKAAIDFRKQGIPAGTYTLRAALNPVDGNHLGISPIRDFLLLTPIALDADPTVKYKVEELTAMSKKTTGSNHPSPLSLVMPDGIERWPSVIEDENRLVFAAKVKTGSAESPIAFVVKGVAEQ